MSYPWTQAQIDAVGRLPLYNGGIYNATTNPYGFAQGGHRVRFALSLNDAAAAAGAVKDAADYAGAKADAAAASASAADASAARLAGTSTTSATLGTGVKSFTTQAGKSFETGRIVRAASAADPTGSYMVGRVSSYSGTALTLAVLLAVGSGAKTDWNLYVESEPGSAGTIAVGTVNDVAPDQPPTVANVGMASAAVLNFGLPRGRPSGLIYKWSTSNAATDPTSGRLKASSSSLTGATALYLSEMDLAGVGQSATLASWDDSTNPVRGSLRIEDIANPANFALFAIIGDLVDNGSWDSLPISYIDKGGTLADGASVRLDFVRAGNKGEKGLDGLDGKAATVAVGTVNSGAAGSQPIITNVGTGASATFNFTIPRGDQGIPGPAVAIAYTFSATVTDANPGNGNVRFNNGTLASVTQLFVSGVEALAGTSMAAWLDSFAASTNPTSKGTLTLKSLADPTKQVVFRVTGSVTADASGYRRVPVAYVAGNGGFTDGGAVGLAFDRAGDAGANGTGAGTVIGPTASTDGGFVIWNGADGTRVQSGGVAGALAYKAKVNNGDWSGVALALANGGTGATDVLGARAALGLVPGTDVQAYSPKLAAYAGQTWAADQAPYWTGAAGLGSYALTTFGRSLAGAVDAPAAQALLQVRPGTDVQAYAVPLADLAATASTSIASAATADIGSSYTRRVTITGTAAITSFGTSAGRERLIHFTDACTLTHNATSLILPTGASIVTAAGDTALATSDASGNWRVRQYQRADGTPLAIGAKGITTSGYQKLPSGLILQWGVVAGSASDQSVTFPTAFPNACFVVVGSTNGNPGGTTMNALVTDGWSTIGFASRPRFASGGTVGISGAQATWIALGW